MNFFSRLLCIIVSSITVFLLSSSCGSSGNDSETLTEVVHSYNDPVGDAFGTGLGSNWDITEVVTTRTGTVDGGFHSLTIEISFTHPVSLPLHNSVPEAIDIAGFVEFDTDQNVATGLLFSSYPSFYDFYCGGVATLGTDYFVSLWYRNAFGNYEVMDYSDTPVGEATPIIFGNSLRLSIQLAALGNDDGVSDTGIVVGNIFEMTDCARNL